MSKDLSDLSDRAKPLIKQVLLALKLRSIDITIVNVLRSIEQQKQHIKDGVSWTLNSKHLPDKDGKSNAIDIVPTLLLRTKGWSPSSPLWQIIGHLAKACGLKWGGDWKQKDMGHIEL